MEEIEGKEAKRGTANSSSHISEDVLRDILSRLSARPFAAAACVNKSWNRVSNRILSRPKLASAISLNESLELAMEEVVNKVLSEPIRPHFAIANIEHSRELKLAYKFLIEKLGSRTPIVVSRPVGGIIGREAATDKFREITWGTEVDVGYRPRYGISLTIGYLPGVKVDAIPLFNPKKEPQGEMIDKFVMDIRDFTASVSGSTSPIGIIMFGGDNMEQKPVIEKLDHAMPREIVIVGDESSQYLYNGGNYSRNMFGTPRDISKTVALVFANDRNKDHGTGNIQFHHAISEGVLAFGPKYEVLSVRMGDMKYGKKTWITARRQGQNNVLDPHQLLHDVFDEFQNHAPHDNLREHDVYIGVTKRRNYSIGSEKPQLMTSLTFHGTVLGGEEYGYLFAYHSGIEAGDTFQFYVYNRGTATKSCDDASESLRILKSDWEAKSSISTSNAHNAMKTEEPFGGFIFSGRGILYFDKPNVDSSPFLKNFPNIPLAGMFGYGEFGRGSSSKTLTAIQENGFVRHSQHVCSTVFLVMTYTPGHGED